MSKSNDLNPMNSTKIFLKKEVKIPKIQIPYDYESRGIEATAACDKNGPHIWIMTHTQEPIRTIFTATQTCYSPYDQAYIAYSQYFKYLTQESSNPNFPNKLIELLCKVAKSKHLSTLEHVSFTFGIRCLSRATLAQFTRHRVGFSFSVQSQRYVSQSDDSPHGSFNYIIPPSVKGTSCEETYINAMEAAQKSYNQMIECGIHPEDARYVFPNAVTTNITVTCNLRAFIDFYEKRNELTNSQWEIQLLAERMKQEILKVEPSLEYLFEVE